MNDVAATASTKVVRRPPPPRDLLVIVQLAIVVVVLVGAAVFYLVFHGRESAPVVYPLAAMLGAAAIFFGVLWWRERAAPFLSLGGLAGGMIVLYGVYPLVVFLASGLHYGPLYDDRMFAVQPPPANVGALAWWYVAYFASFATVYLLVTRGSGSIRVSVDSVPRAAVGAIIALYVAIDGFILAMNRWYDMQATTYVGRFLAVQSLPHFARQIFVNAASMGSTLLILLMCVLFIRYRERRLWILAVSAWMLSSSLIHIGSRGPLMIFIVTVACLYHNLVRRLRTLLVVFVGISFLVLTAWMAAAREELAGSKSFFMQRATEFDVIFSNAYDLKYTQDASGVLRFKPIVYFGEFITVIPQQLLPFKKQLKADWYTGTYYPETLEAGGGLAFGVVAEAITGWGWPELIVRGIIVGFVFGWIHRRFTAKPISLWQLALYVWLMTMSYQLVRNTTFCYLVWLEYQFIEPVIIIRLISYVATSARRRVHALVRQPV